MTAETNVADGVAIARPQARTLFSVTLLIVTVLPLLSLVNAPAHPGIIPIINVLFLIGGTHAFATTYLLADSAVRSFLAAHPVKMLLAPGAMFVAAMILFSHPGNWAFVVGVLITSLYQTWHFGAQNIGVSSFISLSERGRSLAANEKLAIKLGAVAGMLGVLKIMAPTHQIGEAYMPLNSTAVQVIGLFYEFGLFAAIPATALGLYLAVKALQQRHHLSALSIILSVTFLFPMYITQNYIVGFVSFTAAHGLQYLVFLFAHSFNQRKSSYRPRTSLRIIVGLLVLLLSMLIGNFVWQDMRDFGAVDWPTIGLALILSLSLVHFWMDQFLWRMSDKDRANWIKSRFDFIFAAPSH